MDEDLDSVFDVGAVRSALDGRKQKLESELHQMERISEKFNSIHSQLCRMATSASTPPEPAAPPIGGLPKEKDAHGGRARRAAQPMREVQNLSH